MITIQVSKFDLWCWVIYMMATAPILFIYGLRLADRSSKWAIRKIEGRDG